MTKLLTLALTETTQTSYEVVAWNLDDKNYVLIPGLPYNAALVDGKPVWDLFQVTEAEIKKTPNESRSNVFSVLNTLPPTPIGKVEGEDRLTWLHRLSLNKSVDSPLYTNNYVTLVEPEEIIDIIMTPKESCLDRKKPFYWESRIEFVLNNTIWRPAASKIGVASKDLRWKTYWHEITANSPNFLVARDKWLKILNKNRTFFVIEYYNNHKNYVIAGVHSISS
ncbi:hypothetical protein D3C76_436820 [compost metagenome]